MPRSSPDFDKRHDERVSHDGERVGQRDMDVVVAAVYANSFRTLQHEITATGLRTYALLQDGLRYCGADDRVAEQFLVASRLRRHDPEFECSVGTYFTEAGAALAAEIGQEAPASTVVELPEPLELAMALSAAIARRRSIRSYVGESLPLSELATLVWAGCGITAHGETFGHAPFRAAPSGGALYPVDLWVAALDIADLERGVYRYVPVEHELRLAGDADRLDSLLAALAVSDDVVMCSQAAALLLLVARPWRSMRKYGARGMRHVLLEAGMIAGHLNLAAVALGIGSVDCSSVYDDEAHEALGLDGVHEALIHTIVLGISA